MPVMDIRPIILGIIERLPKRKSFNYGDEGTWACAPAYAA